MNPFPEYIKLNGKETRVNDFIKKSHTTEYENELAGFLEEWYAPLACIEVKTSGSTGRPKVIRLKKEFVVNSALRTIKFFNLQPGDRILHCLPVKYIAGKLMVVRALAGNLDLYVTAPGTNFSFLQHEKFRFAAMIPHQVVKILNAEPGSGAWFRNLDLLLIGGSFIPASTESRLQSIPTACYSSYALTETASHIALRKINGQNQDKYYHCLDEVTVRLSKEGCLQICMPGLAMQPLTTTDLAEVKDEKTFRISGRADNVIISGGIKFFPEQLEKKLEPFIDESFLITSLPHASLGQQLVLVIEGTGQKEPEKKYREICLRQLEKYEQPRKIIFIAEIPRTISGKPVRKNIIRRLIR